MIITPYAGFTRPANTTAYAIGDLVANSTTAGSVAPLTFGISKGGSGEGRIKGLRLYKSASALTLAAFRLNLFSAPPVVTNGDNGALAVATAASFIGNINIDMESGAFTATTGAMQNVAASPDLMYDLGDYSQGRIIYGLLEARAAYVPASAEMFIATLLIESCQ